MITLETIQKNIIEAIRQCGMTQTAIAKEMHMSQSTIAHYVRGDILPALDTLANLCAVLDLDANEILGINQK